MEPPEHDDEPNAPEVTLHLRVGLWGLLLFALLGLGLEALHAYKAPLYLDVANETRRLLWRLGHAHGALLSLFNVVIALAVPRLHRKNPSRRRLGSRALVSATVLLPAGFWLAGLGAESGDAGAGIALVPAGAVLLAVALFTFARGIDR
ncbi:MAG TPA: hypothetical protein VF989_02785 [Polyangiaceae bacterium]